MKSEEAFFGKVRKDKLSSAASIRSSQRDSVWGTPSPSIYSRPDCKSFFNLILIPMLISLQPRPPIISRSLTLRVLFLMTPLNRISFP